MPFISLTTDYGLNSGYVAQIKNELNKSLSLPVIIDISHLIEPFNLLQAAFIVRTTYKKNFQKIVFILLGLISIKILNKILLLHMLISIILFVRIMVFYHY